VESILTNFILSKTDIIPIFCYYKFGHFILNTTFSSVPNAQAYKEKLENEEKKILQYAYPTSFEMFHFEMKFPA
jgi:hypothetical protein